VNIIDRAKAKRDSLRRELEKIESFLATAYELEHELGQSATKSHSTTATAVKEGSVRRARTRGEGTGSATLQVVADALRERGSPMTSKELLPIVLAKGIEVGGKSPLGTLSARISQKGIVESKDNKWWFVEGSQSSNNELFEALVADSPGKDQSATSFSGDNSEGGEANANTTN
jgi:hypothetical protein